MWLVRVQRKPVPSAYLTPYRLRSFITWPPAPSTQAPSGFSLIELVITLTVLTILTPGVIPLVQTAVRRQRKQNLREALREIRSAIDEFNRDITFGNSRSYSTHFIRNFVT